jgi:predicted AlkP superfamily pyrophosphatase or phosphodiesterase
LKNTARLRCSKKRARLGIPVEKQMEWCKLGNAGKAQRDYMYSQLAQHIIKKHKPNFLAIHLVSLDSFEHAHGRQVPEAYWAANDSDNRVADLIRATEEAGIRDKTTFVITTDHGFVTYTKSINPNALLRKDGLVKSVLGKSLAPDSQVFAMAEGGASFVYVLDEANRDSILKQITPKLAKMEGVSGVVEAKDFDSKLHHLTADKDPASPISCCSQAMATPSPIPSPTRTKSSPTTRRRVRTAISNSMPISTAAASSAARV